MNGVPYASAVGSIMYAMLCTRPDVSYGSENRDSIRIVDSNLIGFFDDFCYPFSYVNPFNLNWNDSKFVLGFWSQVNLRNPKPYSIVDVRKF